MPSRPGSAGLVDRTARPPTVEVVACRDPCEARPQAVGGEHLEQHPKRTRTTRLLTTSVDTCRSPLAKSEPRWYTTAIVDKEHLIMTTARDDGSASNVRGPTKKEWRQPNLRKLPIVATAGGKIAGNEGNTSKGGDAGDLS
jgi:hypothetical protein